MTQTLNSFENLGSVFANHGYCGVETARGRYQRENTTCGKPLALHREGEGRTLKMWLECPDHGRKWRGR